MSPIGHCQHFRSHQRQWWAWGLLFPDPLFFWAKVYPAFLEDVGPIVLHRDLFSIFFFNPYTQNWETALNMKDKVNFKKMFCLDENSWRRKRPEFFRQILFWGSPHLHLWSHGLGLSWKRGVFIFVCRRCGLKDILKWRWKASSFHYLEAWRSKPFNTVMQQLLFSKHSLSHGCIRYKHQCYTASAPKEMLCNSVCSAGLTESQRWWDSEPFWMMGWDWGRRGEERDKVDPFAHPCSVILSCSSKTKLLNLSPRPWSPLSSLIPFCSLDTMVPGFSPHLRAVAHAGLAAWNVISSSSLLSSHHSSNLNQTPSSISWTPRLDRVLTGPNTTSNCRINRENNCQVPVSSQEYKHQG